MSDHQESKFRPNALAVVAAALMLLLIIFDNCLGFVLNPASLNPDRVVSAIGRIVTTTLSIFLVAWIGGWIVFNLSGRKNRAGNLSFSGVLILIFLFIFLPNFLEGVNRKKIRAAAPNQAPNAPSAPSQTTSPDASPDDVPYTTGALAEIKAKAREDMQNPAAVHPGGAMMEPMLEAMRKELEIATGDEKVVIEEMMGVMVEFQAAIDVYANAFNKVNQGDDLSPWNKASKEALVESRKSVQLAMASAARIMEVQRLLPQNLESRLVARKLPRETIDLFLAHFTKGFGENSGPSRRIRELDVAYCGEMIAIIEILHTHWGNWTLQEDGDIQFSENVPDEVVESYKNHLAAYYAAAREQETLNQQLLGGAGGS